MRHIYGPCPTEPELVDIEDGGNSNGPFDPPTGGGGNDNDDDTNDDSTDTSPINEPINYAEEIITCINGTNVIGGNNISLTQAQQDWLNSASNRDLIPLEDYLDSNACSLEAQSFASDAVDAEMEDIDFKNKIISNELTDKEKCLDDHLKKSGNNFVKDLLDNFQGDDSEFSISIKSKNQVYLNVNGTNVEVNAKTIYTPNSNVIQIEINSSKASSNKALQVVRTLLHEYIHADMFRKLNTNNPTNGDLEFIEIYNSFEDNNFEPTQSHETMAKLYIEEMKNALKSFHENVMTGDYNYLSNNGQISLDDFYEGLAWQGLKNHNVQAWIDLPQSRKDEINNILNNIYIPQTTSNCP